jgi:hypothetical protein
MNGGSALTIFDNKLWLGTAGMSCFTRPLSDFGYPPVVVTDSKNETKKAGETALSIYPNPANETLKINGLYESANIEIYGLQGELIHSIKNTNSTYLTLDIRNFPNGIYFVKVSDRKGNVSTGKFVKD